MKTEVGVQEYRRKNTNTYVSLHLSIFQPPIQISTQLDLPSYTDRLWEIQACSALKGLGLQQAFMSVHKLIKKSWEEMGKQMKSGTI